MKFALMQPYFFPYSGYFSLIASVDEFMFFDNVQYVRKSWMSRNRLMNPLAGEFFYIRPGLRKPAYKAQLEEVFLDEQFNWKGTLLSQLDLYKSKAPFFLETKTALSEFLLSDRSSKLSELNKSSISWICQYLGLSTKLTSYNSAGFALNELDPGSWGVEVAKEVGASAYINSPGGDTFIPEEPFNEAGIRLGFIRPDLPPYVQGETKFLSGLSILDQLLFIGKEGTRDYVDKYVIDWKN